MKFSKYNKIIEHKGQKLLYNSLSNAFAKLDENQNAVFNKLAKQEIDPSTLQEKLLKQLIDAKIIVNSDEEELLFLRHETNQLRYTDKRLELTIVPTLDCNFACPYCYETNQNINIDDKTINSIIEFAKKHESSQSIYVNWMGGEPLLDFENIKKITEKLLALGKTYNANLITNGFLLDEKVIDQLEKLHIDSVQITLDGMETTHNERRFLKNNKEKTFNTIVDNIRKLLISNSNTLLGVRVNIDEKNQDEYIKLSEFLYRQFDSNNFFVYPAFVDDITEKENTCMLNKTKQVDFLVDLYYKYGYKEFHFYPQNDIYECAIRNVNSYVIGPKGELYTCWNNIGNKNHIVGNVKDERFSNFSLHLKYKIGADPFDDEKCTSCNIFPICKGGCPDVRIRNIYHGQNITPCSKYKGKGLTKLLKAHYDVKNNM